MKKISESILVSKSSTFVDPQAKIGKNVIIYENNRIDGECVIEDNVTIYPNCFITNSIIGKGSIIYTSTIKNSVIGECSIVLPYSYIARSKLKRNSKIGPLDIIKNKK